MKSHILIIDDDLAMCELLDKMFGRSYTVTTKNNGMDAMLWLDKGNMPDLIITDIDMPNLNGVDFLMNVKNSGYYKDVPIIVITGYNDKEHKLKCLKYGAYEYFVKPFNPRDLLFTSEIVLKHIQKKISTEV